MLHMYEHLKKEYHCSCQNIVLFISMDYISQFWNHYGKKYYNNAYGVW